MRKPIVALLLFLSLNACELPKDPQGTTEIVRNATLIVGVPDGSTSEDQREQAAIGAIAAGLGAEIEIRAGELHELVYQVKSGTVHLLAGGIPKDTVFRKEIAISNPVSSVRIGDKREDTAFGLRKGENRFLMMINKAIRETSPHDR